MMLSYGKGLQGAVERVSCLSNFALVHQKLAVAQPNSGHLRREKCKMYVQYIQFYVPHFSTPILYTCTDIPIAYTLHVLYVRMHASTYTYRDCTIETPSNTVHIRIYIHTLSKE